LIGRIDWGFAPNPRIFARQKMDNQLAFSV
jgi:hypothetical protein